MAHGVELLSPPAEVKNMKHGEGQFREFNKVPMWDIFGGVLHVPILGTYRVVLEFGMQSPPSRWESLGDYNTIAAKIITKDLFTKTFFLRQLI